jgi:hypothetical protein
MDSVTVFVSEVTVLPSTSRTTTAIAGAMALATGVVVGCVVNASDADKPGVSVIADDVTLVRPALAKISVRGPTSPFSFRFVNAACPDAFVTTLVVPPSRPPPDEMFAVTVTPAKETALPLRSASWTTGCAGSATPLCALADGCVTIVSPVGVGAVTVTAVAPTFPFAFAEIVVVPGETPVTTPVAADTDATPASALLQTATGMGLQPVCVTVAESATVARTVTVGLMGETVTAVTEHVGALELPPEQLGALTGHLSPEPPHAFCRIAKATATVDSRRKRDGVQLRASKTRVARCTPVLNGFDVACGGLILRLGNHCRQGKRNLVSGKPGARYIIRESPGPSCASHSCSERP